MNKSELIESLVNNSYLSRKDVNDCIDEIINFCSESLSQGKRIELRGFGTFSTRLRKERIARNPKTGSSVRVEAKLHPYFRAAKSLRTNLIS